MREKNGLKSFAGKKLQGGRCLAQPSNTPPLCSGAPGAKRDSRLPRHRDGLQQQQERLLHEIKRGREYLQRVQNELDESRASLEHWNRYEMISLAHPLDHLIQTMALQEKTQQFLIGWLDRQQEKLAKLKKSADGCSPASESVE
jgi:hypothetical protein